MSDSKQNGSFTITVSGKLLVELKEIARVRGCDLSMAVQVSIATQGYIEKNVAQGRRFLLEEPRVKLPWPFGWVGAGSTPPVSEVTFHTMNQAGFKDPS